MEFTLYRSVTLSRIIGTRAALANCSLLRTCKKDNRAHIPQCIFVLDQCVPNREGLLQAGDLIVDVASCVLIYRLHRPNECSVTCIALYRVSDVSLV